MRRGSITNETGTRQFWCDAGYVTRAVLRDDGLQGVAWAECSGALLGPIEYTIKVGDYLECWMDGPSAIVAYRINGKGMITTGLWTEAQTACLHEHLFDTAG